jgi:signal transduction histidine kinase
VVAISRAPAWVWSVIDWLMALGLAAVSQYEIWSGSIPAGSVGPRGAHAAMWLVMTVPLGLRRCFPAAVLVTVATAAVVGFAALFDLSAQTQPDPFLIFLIAIYSVGAHAEGRPAVFGGIYAAAAVVAIDLPAVLAGSIPEDVYAWLLYALAFMAGRALRSRQKQAADAVRLADLAEAQREQQAQRAVVDERSRIARELHDVIAHGLSVIVVQAAAEQRVLPEGNESTREVLGAIERTGRQALVELRHLLGVVRRTDEGLELSPQPGLDRLDELVAEMRDAGLHVDVRVEGAPSSLPAGVDLTAFRIVQEGLTNVLKHANCPHAEVVIRYSDADLDLQVLDHGPGASAPAIGGQGLVGMRERVAIYSGTFDAARHDGGFRLHARLPRDPARP